MVNKQSRVASSSLSWGHTIEGAITSLKITLKEQAPVLPLLSVASKNIIVFTETTVPGAGF